MKLLIVTQKMDRNDPILGFFHRWVEEFAKHLDQVIVICLEDGVHDLPQNVRVLSLGKESGKSRLKYVRRFYKHIWQERKNYDGVFVHMNQEYVLLGWVLWKLASKRILLWRNHFYGNVYTRIAIFLSNKVFCTSPQSFTARFSKTSLMPVGIDTDTFKINEDIPRKKNSIIFVGRISPVKNTFIFIEALNDLAERGVDFKACVAGGVAEKNVEYGEMVFEEAESLVSEGKLEFLGEITNDKMPELYNKHEIVVNLTQSGSLDKVIFEAMACGAIPLVFNRALTESLGPDLIISSLDAKVISGGLKRLLDNVPVLDPQVYRNMVVRSHSLRELAESVISHV